MSWLFGPSKKDREEQEKQREEQKKQKKQKEEELNKLMNESNKKIHKIDGDCYITGFLYVDQGASVKGNVMTESVMFTSTDYDTMEFRRTVDEQKKSNHNSKKFLENKFIPITNNDLIEKINELEKRYTEKINELEEKINKLINNESRAREGKSKQKLLLINER